MCLADLTLRLDLGCNSLGIWVSSTPSTARERLDILVHWQLASNQHQCCSCGSWWILVETTRAGERVDALGFAYVFCLEFLTMRSGVFPWGRCDPRLVPQGNRDRVGAQCMIGIVWCTRSTLVDTRSGERVDALGFAYVFVWSFLFVWCF